VRRSCLVMLVLVAAVLLVVSVSLRRCFLADSASQTTTQARHEAQATQPEVVSRATLDEALVSVAKESGNGTEGLALDTLRPLSTEHITVSGLAVSEDRVYATGCDASGQCGQILVTDVKALTPQARTSVAHDGFPRAGGVLVSGDALWVWLLADGADDATMVVVLDRETLSERSRLALKGAARALVRDPEGMIYGASADGRLLFRWEPDGVLVARHVSATGANYSDCELISGSLVCSGVREDGLGVLDVLDTEQFSLLARHVSGAVTEGGDRVVGGAWAFWQDRFCFVPAGGEMPILWSYSLDGGSLEQYIPSVQP
jgi:heme exporter protein D